MAAKPASAGLFFRHSRSMCFFLALKAPGSVRRRRRLPVIGPSAISDNPSKFAQLVDAMPSVLDQIRRWVLAICLIMMVNPVLATGDPSAGQKPAFAGWLDRNNTATAETVQQHALWEPFTGWKSWGYGSEPVWVRVTVPASPRADAPSNVLIVRPPHLDRVTFFDPATGAVRHAGDFLPAREDALGSVLFTFELPARTEAREVLIKLESTSTRLVYLSMMPLAEAQSFTRWVEWATGGALLLSLVFWVWAMVQWRISRDRVTAAFAFKQFMVTIWGFSLFGFARVTVGELFSPGVLSLMTDLSAALMVAAVMWFLAALLQEYGPRQWMLRLLQLGGGLALASALFNLTGPAHLALQVLNSLVAPLLAWVVIALWIAHPGQNQPPIPKAVMLAYVCFYAFLNAIPTLTHVGLIPESRILFFGNMSSLVANGLVMLIILNVRQRRFKVQHEAMATQLMLQQEQARLDQQYLDDQRQLLAMLAHEMKTPLANLRIWMEAGDKGRPVMERAIGDMSRVIERCVHTGQLADQSLQPRNEWLDAAELTQTVLASSRQPERVQLNLPPDVCPVLTDAQMLSIVLSNVLENAYKYSAPESTIALRLESAKGPMGEAGWRWQLDNSVGPYGLPDPVQLFKKYYRSPLARRKSGSGLGLYLVKALLSLMQGKIVFTVLEDQARFEVWLPCQAPPRPIGS